MILILIVCALEVLGTCENSSVCCGCGNASRIHKCNGSNLSVLDLGTFSVGEVPGGVTDAECIVGRCISCAKAGTAKCGLKDCACLKDLRSTAVFDDLHINRH